MPLAELLEFQTGSVLTLDKGIEETVEVLVGGKVIAYGEIVAVGDNMDIRLALTGVKIRPRGPERDDRHTGGNQIEISAISRKVGHSTGVVECADRHDRRGPDGCP